jgi:hypothetical protein
VWGIETKLDIEEHADNRGRISAPSFHCSKRRMLPDNMGHSPPKYSDILSSDGGQKDVSSMLTFPSPPFH